MSAVRRSVFVIAMAVVMASASGASAAGGWGSAREVPGTATLNAGGLAEVMTVSCPAIGDCAAGGFYQDVFGRRQAFVVNRVNGRWGTAIEVPGTAVLNKGRGAMITSVSCPSAGNCGAVGAYSDSGDVGHAFVVNEVDGSWHAAIRVSGIPWQGPIGGAVINSVSCPSAGNCSAGGYYQSFRTRDYVHAFVVNEVNGTWDTAIEVPGLATLNQGVNAQVSSVSCGLAGYCGAGGFYTDAAKHTHAFVVSEVHGKWNDAEQAPGTAVWNDAQVTSVSCPSPGGCGVGGYFTDQAGHTGAFVESKVNGVWRGAVAVPGLAALNQGGNAQVTSVSCPFAGECGVGGYYQDKDLRYRPFVASEVNGVWRSAAGLPGDAALNTGGNMRVVSVSCPSPGNCGVGGFYVDSSDRWQVFVDDEMNGTWGAAVEVPGTAALNAGGYAQQSSVSCAAAGKCSAGGSYNDASHLWQAYLTDEGGYSPQGEDAAARSSPVMPSARRSRSSPAASV